MPPFGLFETDALLFEFREKIFPTIASKRREGLCETPACNSIVHGSRFACGANNDFAEAKTRARDRFIRKSSFGQRTAIVWTAKFGRRPLLSCLWHGKDVSR